MARQSHLGDRRVIFVCVGNSCRSQMAEGFFNHLAPDYGVATRAESAGTAPKGHVDPGAVKVMAEKGIDISQHRSKGITPEQLLAYDYVITMGCSDKDVCPVTFRGDSRDWAIEDPAGQPLETYRRVRDEIEQKGVALLEELAS